MDAQTRLILAEIFAWVGPVGIFLLVNKFDRDLGYTKTVLWKKKAFWLASIPVLLFSITVSLFI